MATTLPDQIRDATPADIEYVLASDVILLTVQDGTTRLLNLGGRFCSISAIGTQMLQEVLARGFATAVQHITLRYGVDTQRVQTDLRVFLRNLEKQGVVCRRTSQHPGRFARIIPFLCISPALFLIHHCLRSTSAKAWVLLAVARLSFAVFGWTRTLSVWQWRHRLSTKDIALEGQEEMVRTVDEAVRRAAVKHVFKVECKERALSCWALSRALGVPTSLVVGVRVFPLEGHCWCKSGAWIFSDDRDRCEEYTPVVIYS